MKETVIVIASALGLLAGFVGLITGAAMLYAWLKKKDQGYPHEALIEAAILPYIQKAILAAFKVSETLVDETGQRLHGLDKAKIATAVYRMLPQAIQLNIGGYMVNIPIGQLVTEEWFKSLIERTFDDFLSWYNEQFDKWGDLVHGHLDAEVT